MYASIRLRVILGSYRRAMDTCDDVCLCSGDVLYDSPGSFSFGILLRPFRGRLCLPTVFVGFDGLGHECVRHVNCRYGFSFLFFVPVFGRSG